jgi:predicted glycosyltransferase
MMRAHNAGPDPLDRLSGSTVATRPRVALYSHDTMGIGHVRRNLLIAQALAAPPLSATVLLVAGVKEAIGFAMPPGTDCLTLPSLSKTPDGQYQSRALGLSLRAFRPDVFVVDKEPLGAVGELRPALRALRASGRTRCVLGLRDVLDDAATVRREWEATRNEEAIRDYYHAVWVYGDAAVYDPVREYRFGADVQNKAVYTGYLDPRDRLRGIPRADRSECDLPDGSFVLCTVGGGQDGAGVAEAFAASELPSGLSGVVITGPYMPPEARRRVRDRAADDQRFRALEFVAEPCRLLARAARVIAMGGYNTVSEVLAFGKPALIVPRVSPRREQLIRAERLRDLGLLDVLLPDAVSPQALSRWLRSEPARNPGARQPIDLNAAVRLPALVRALLTGTTSDPVSPCHPEVQHAAR